MNVPEAGGKHPIMARGFASGTHLGRPELCNPSNSIAQAHLYNLQPAQSSIQI